MNLELKAMIDKPLYTPDQTDIEWAKRMMDGTSDGGVLSFPSAQLIYEVDHDKKILTLQNPERLVSHFDSFVTHQQTKIVFAQIGYTVKEIKRRKGFEEYVLQRQRNYYKLSHHVIPLLRLSARISRVMGLIWATHPAWAFKSYAAAKGAKERKEIEAKRRTLEEFTPGSSRDALDMD